MQITVSVKQLGQKRPLISQKVIGIDDIGPNPTVRCLLEVVVEQQVQEFNNKPLETNLLPFLDQESMDAGARSGKLGFNSIYNEAKADPAAAKRTVIQAFEDGLIVLFANEREFTRTDEIITLDPNTIITFIRLTFLAGGYW